MGWMIERGRESVRCRARWGSRFVTVEPVPAQRKDSVLRRDIKGSVLTFCSATHTHKLIINQYCGAPERAQTRSAAISAPDWSHPGVFPPDFDRLGVKGSDEILQIGLDHRFPRLAEKAVADLEGELPNRKATVLKCQAFSLPAPAAMKCTRRPVSGPSRL